MKKFKTITEKRILTLAIYSLMEKKDTEEKRIKGNPNSKISQHWIDTYNQQIDEIHDRILGLERKMQ